MRYGIDRAVFLNQILSGTDVCTYARNCSGSHYKILLHDRYRDHYTLFTAQSMELILCNRLICFWIIIRRNLVMSRVMKMTKKEKIVVCRSWRRIKSIAYGAINKISEALSSTRFWVKARKLHVWPCIYCEKCFQEVILMEGSDEEDNRLRLGWDSGRQDLFDGSPILLV